MPRPIRHTRSRSWPSSNRRASLSLFPSDPLPATITASTPTIFSLIEDPHELYKHWPPDIWGAIDQHQVKLGMNELQVDFALGMGVLDHSGDSAVKTAHYAN